MYIHSVPFLSLNEAHISKSFRVFFFFTASKISFVFTPNFRLLSFSWLSSSETPLKELNYASMLNHLEEASVIPIKTAL